MTSFALDPHIDWDAAGRSFASERRVRLQPFLDRASADALHAHLAARDDWLQVILSGDKLIELDRATRATFSAERRERLDQAIYAGARSGFQYRYETLRVPDDDEARAACGAPLSGFARFMSAQPVLERLRAVTGRAAMTFADAQATAYAPGDFLTSHTDAVAGKHRLAAYVLGLTPGWRIDWGGLLLMAGGGGRIDALVPAFNALDLFAVPVDHSVSLVSPAAPRRRLSVTGWLRAAGD